MAFLPEDKDTRLLCYGKALEKWAYGGVDGQGGGYVEIPKERHREWLRVEFPDLSWREIKRLMFEHVTASGAGAIKEVVETRPEYTSYQFHYDLRVPISGRRVYFETVLICDDADELDDCVIYIVNVKDV